MRKKRFWLIVVIPFLVLLGAYVASEVMKGARQPEPEEGKISSLKTVERYTVITGFCFSEYISGAKKFEIKAEEASIRPKRIAFFKTPLIKETHMVKPEITFFAEDKEVSHIAADSGKINMFNRKILLKGDVKLITADGKELSAKTMSVNPKSGLLSIGGRFTLKRNGDIIKGKGLKSDINLERFSIRTRQEY